MVQSGFKGSALLVQLFDTDQYDGELQQLYDECGEQMREIERTAQETGGKPTRSARYRDARAVQYHITQLKALADGRYTHDLPEHEA